MRHAGREHASDPQGQGCSCNWFAPAADGRPESLRRGRDFEPNVPDASYAAPQRPVLPFAMFLCCASSPERLVETESGDSGVTEYTPCATLPREEVQQASARELETGDEGVAEHTPDAEPETDAESEMSGEEVGRCPVSNMPLFRHKHHQAKYSRQIDASHLEVMANPEDYMYALIPKGEHGLKSLILYPDVKPRPAHVVIKDFEWKPAPKTGGHGQLTLPDFDGHVPTQMASPAFLAYYSCGYAADVNQPVNLKVDHEIMDFNYDHYKEKWVKNPKYGAGGLGLERHEFIHLECPLADFDESGHLLIAKVVEEENELHVTAFKIPQYHTVYLAPFAIHSNDHMNSTWRTMLSTFSEEDTAQGLNYIDHALLKDPNGKDIDLKFSKNLHKQKSFDDQGKHHDRDTMTKSRSLVKRAFASVSSQAQDVYIAGVEAEAAYSEQYASLVKRMGHGRHADLSLGA